MAQDSPPSLLQVKQLSVAFRGRNRLTGEMEENRVVDRVSFDVKAGRTIALVGESGSGKSVSALSVLKLLPYPAASHPSGQVIYKEQDLLQMKEGNLRAIRGREIAMIFQEPMTSLNPLHRLGKQLIEAIQLHQPLSDKASLEKAQSLLAKVGLESLRDRLDAFPHQLSGGQRQRVMIAMALANDPDILIADEPTTALDVTVQAEILELLKQLQKQHNMALLLITHDLTIVKHMAHEVAVMHQGNLVEQGETKTLFNAPQHDYTRMLLGAAPRGRPVKLNAANQGQKVIEANRVSVRFPTKKGFFGKVKASFTAVDSISVAIEKGETLGVVGESGSGKTTMAMALLRLIESEGKITLNGKPIHGYGKEHMRELRQSMQVVFQDPYASLNPRLTIGQILEEGLLAHQIGKDKQARKTLAEAALEEVELDPEFYHRYPHALSGGQRQRVGVARALILKPDIIMLDEPTSALDVSTQSAILKVLKNIQKKRGIAYLFITHDLRVIKTIAHHIVVMKDGKIIESGTREQLFKEPKRAYTKRLLKAALIK